MLVCKVKPVKPWLVSRVYSVEIIPKGPYHEPIINYIWFMVPICRFKKKKKKLCRTRI